MNVEVVETSEGLKDPALIDDYLREMAGQGHVFVSAALPSDLKTGAQNECFANCLLAALKSNGKYLYCEGIGIVENQAYAHAWLTDADRQHAYDLTWLAIRGDGQIMTVPAVYKGVILDTQACWNYVRRTKRPGVISNRNLRPYRYKKVLQASNLKEVSA